MTLKAEIHERSLLPFWFVYPRFASRRELASARNEIEEWCLEQFGPTHQHTSLDDETPRWEPHGTMMCIRDRLDAAVFKMRWC